ncbi:hypothetical protein GUJ93_ZPchr0010g7573 [Zizania palustris]|uniref:Uncharacterized protein n=1 Tax=Zizania palustris TaxID=103762 RepID=A0A8J6BR34_ZIZPA|nr:hypothetical protein GUJ93_ZPchr0010g7573 [Zizania palustris]
MSDDQHRCCALDIPRRPHKPHHDLCGYRALDAHAIWPSSRSPDLHDAAPYLHRSAAHRNRRCSLHTPPHKPCHDLHGRRTLDAHAIWPSTRCPDLHGRHTLPTSVDHPLKWWQCDVL